MSQDTCLTNALEKTSSQDQNISTKNLIDKESQSYDSPENNVTLPDVQTTSSENKVRSKNKFPRPLLMSGGYALQIFPP